MGDRHFRLPHDITTEYLVRSNTSLNVYTYKFTHRGDFTIPIFQSLLSDKPCKSDALYSSETINILSTANQNKSVNNDNNATSLKMWYSYVWFSGVGHGHDMAYHFTGWLPATDPSPADQKMRDIMVKLWVNFATTGYGLWILVAWEYFAGIKNCDTITCANRRHG